MRDEAAHGGLRIENANFLLPNGIRVAIPRIEIPNGGLLIVAGPNGGGKTSLASFLCGLRREMPFKDHNQFPTMCWQQPELVPGTLLDNLNVVRGGRKYALPPDGDIAAALRYIDLYPEQRKSAAAISVGQAQRLNIARTLLTSRFGIVLDEPSASLDYQGVELLVAAMEVYLRRRTPSVEAKWIEALVVERRFVICITHDRTLIERLSVLNPRFVAIDQNSFRRGPHGNEVTIDTNGGAGYTIAEVRTRAPSLFWAEFYDTRNIFYTLTLAPVDSLVQLRRRKAGTLGFVIIPDKDVRVQETQVRSGSVKGNVCEIDYGGDSTRLLVEFYNQSDEVVSIWVTANSAEPWMKVNGEVWVSIGASYPVRSQVSEAGC